MPQANDPASRAATALRAGGYTQDWQEGHQLVDFLADARHLCDREGWDFSYLVEISEEHARQ